MEHSKPRSSRRPLVAPPLEPITERPSVEDRPSVADGEVVAVAEHDVLTSLAALVQLAFMHVELLAEAKVLKPFAQTAPSDYEMACAASVLAPAVQLGSGPGEEAGVSRLRPWWTLCFVCDPWGLNGSLSALTEPLERDIVEAC